VKKIIFLVLAFFLASCAVGRGGNEAPQEYYHLFILSGQSNMERMDINYFLPIVEDEFGPDHVIAVKFALGGQSITQWYDKNDIEDDGDVVGWLYYELMSKVFDAIAGQYIASVTFVWMHGERDAYLGGLYVQDYEENLLGLIELIESELVTNINFVIGRLSGYVLPPRNRSAIREIQVEVANGYPKGSWINTDDIPRVGGVDVHYADPEGYILLGSRFADAAISLIKPN
jgi:hypothetical protein